jgi:Transposase DDE domain
MTPQEIDNKFQELQQELPSEFAILAKEYGVFVRARKIKSPVELLRVVLLYSIGDLSLRELAGWMIGHRCRITDEALRVRLHGCVNWVKAILGLMLPPLKLPEGAIKNLQVEVVDASVVNGPGSQGTDYRLHLSLDPLGQKITDLQVYDVKTAESVTLFNHDGDRLILGDRGFARPGPLIATRKKGNHFLVRMTPSYMSVYDEAGQKIDLIATLRAAGEEQLISLTLQIRDRKTDEQCQAYLHALHMNQAERQKARHRTARKANRDRRKPRAQTLFLAEWVLILTSLPPTIFPAPIILELYRVRWQVELLIKRMKSLLNADALRAHLGSPLAELYLLGKLLFVLLVEARTLKRVGNHTVQMTRGRKSTWWRIWALIASEIKEAIINTVAFDRFDWRQVFKVLGERKRKRKLQVIPAAVAHWLRNGPITGPL